MHFFHLTFQILIITGSDFNFNLKQRSFLSHPTYDSLSSQESDFEWNKNIPFLYSFFEPSHFQTKNSYIMSSIVYVHLDVSYICDTISLFNLILKYNANHAANCDVEYIGANSSKYCDRSSIPSITASKFSFNIVHLNACSIRPKIDEIRLIFENQAFDAITISETWLKPSKDTNKSVEIQGYRIFRNDRPCRAGGVAIYVSSKFKYTKIIAKSTYTAGCLEYILVEIKLFDSSIQIGSFYQPNKDTVWDFETVLSNSVLMYDDLVLAGDFNVDMLVASDCSSHLKSVLDTFSLEHLPLSATHYSRTSPRTSPIDLLIVRKNRGVKSFGQWTLSGVSDHDIIYCTYNVRRGHRVDEYIDIHDYNSIDLNAIFADANNTNWQFLELLSRMDAQATGFNDIIKTLIQRYVPQKSILKKSETTPWIRPKILRNIKLREIAYKKMIRSRLPADSQLLCCKE